MNDGKITYQNINWEEVRNGCIQNKRASQEILYRHFFPIMERMVMRYTRDEDQIIDILNNGFLRVFQKINLFNNKGSFEGWIRKIVYHSVSDYFRSSSKDLKFMIYEDEFKKEPSQDSSHKLYYQDLIKLLDKLPEKHMRVFHLFSIEGYSHKEISNQLSINENTCRWYLAESRKILQKEYAKIFENGYNEAG
ncbi:MAG: sigma-70 family RNA polymerase sigma factor [Bacteroidia bacterium]|nr:sigma-70 family RNA polymerase sigma factor [Bacteroidia bacterium]